MKKILILSNHPSWTYNLRKEIIEALIEEGYDVTIVVGYGKEIDYFKERGCSHIDVPFNRHGKNPFGELKLFNAYKKAINTVKPDIVLSYTIKPNLYGAYLCHKKGIPCIANITGLGTAVEYPGLMRDVLLKVYKFCFKDIYKVFFQNTMNRDLFLSNSIVKNNYQLIPGSGVNTSKFGYLPFPDNDTTEFVFVSRIMKEKGIDQYLDAAVYHKKKYPFTRFHICGFCEQDYEEKIRGLAEQGIIINHGMVSNVSDVLMQVQCLVLPTYYPEGMSNVLLESCSSGRPIITTDRPGCREIVDDGYNGFVVKEKDSKDLIEKIDKFINMPYDERVKMGENGRRKVQNEFERQIVVDCYIRAIKEALIK
jgi:glycosyltransferase involved in cell wall biosynthesis